MDAVLQQFSGLLIAAVDFVPRLVVGVLVFLVFLLLARLVGLTVERLAEKMDEEMRRLLSRLAGVTTIVIGTIVALDQVSFNVTAFVAGLGLIGFTLGFAVQDIAKNFVAGVLLLIQQPFEIGDAIEVVGHQGTVTDVDVRATTIKAWDGQEVIVPNADVYTSPIINYSRYPARRIVLGIGLGYEEDLAQAEEVFLRAITNIEDVLDDPPAAVYCKSLGSSSVEMEAYFWVDQTRSSLLEATSKAVQALKGAAALEGISLPYPIQTVRLRQLAEGEPL